MINDNVDDAVFGGRAPGVPDVEPAPPVLDGGVVDGGVPEQVRPVAPHAGAVARALVAADGPVGHGDGILTADDVARIAAAAVENAVENAVEAVLKRMAARPAVVRATAHAAGMDHREEHQQDAVSVVSSSAASENPLRRDDSGDTRVPDMLRDAIAHPDGDEPLCPADVFGPLDESEDAKKQRRKCARYFYNVKEILPNKDAPELAFTLPGLGTPAKWAGAEQDKLLADVTKRLMTQMRGTVTVASRLEVLTSLLQEVALSKLDVEDRADVLAALDAVVGTVQAKAHLEAADISHLTGLRRVAYLTTYPGVDKVRAKALHEVLPLGSRSGRVLLFDENALAERVEADGKARYWHAQSALGASRAQQPRATNRFEPARQHHQPTTPAGGRVFGGSGRPLFGGATKRAFGGSGSGSAPTWPNKKRV